MLYTPAIASCLALGIGIHAQPELRPVEAGLEDVSPIGASERVQPQDFRNPTGFDRVYEITRPDGTRSYVRVSGALYAEFDQAWYNPLGEAVVPPGTRFTIGRPSAEAAAAQGTSGRPAHNAVSLRADPRRPANEPPTSPRREHGDRIFDVGEPSIVSNELYRRIRITELLHSTQNPAHVKPSAASPQQR